MITPTDVKSGMRGADNWRREVRMVCWSDNTRGEMLLAGETCTPSGNWSTVPPHRHQYDVPSTVGGRGVVSLGDPHLKRAQTARTMRFSRRVNVQRSARTFARGGLRTAPAGRHPGRHWLARAGAGAALGQQAARKAWADAEALPASQESLVDNGAGTSA